jgi:hypothetical protein
VIQSFHQDCFLIFIWGDTQFGALLFIGIGHTDPSGKLLLDGFLWWWMQLSFLCLGLWSIGQQVTCLDEVFDLIMWCWHTISSCFFFNLQVGKHVLPSSPCKPSSSNWSHCKEALLHRFCEDFNFCFLTKSKQRCNFLRSPMLSQFLLPLSHISDIWVWSPLPLYSSIPRCCRSKI